MEFNQNLTRYLIKQTQKFTDGDQQKAQEMVRLTETLYLGNLANGGLILPIQKAQIARLVEGIAREKLMGQQLKVVSPVCPDYSYHFDHSENRIVYDFNTLNTGIGLSAQAVLEKTPTFIKALRRLGVSNIHYLMLYADVEADDPNILESVGLNKAQFLDKVTQSCKSTQIATSDSLDADISVDCMSSFLQDTDYQRANRMVQLIQPATLHSLGTQRKDLYSRWFKSRFKGLNMIEIDDLRSELAGGDVLKSLTFGSAARREGVFILDSTDPSFTGFYNYGDGLPPTPVITTKRDLT
jgi:hypothetical protein